MNYRYKTLVNYKGEKHSVTVGMTAVDPVKFQKIIDAKELSATDMSVKMGYHPTTLAKAVKVGYVNAPMIKLLDTLYGIKKEDIEYIPKAEEPVKKPEPAPEPATVKDDGEKLAQLYNVIKAAVLDGMNEAIAGNLKNVRGAMYTAIYQGFNAAKKDQPQ